MKKKVVLDGLECTDTVHKDSVVSDINSAVENHEPELVEIERTFSKSQKRVLVLIGLGCASCAAKIEREIGSLPGVVSAHLDFISKRLTIQAMSGSELDSISEKVHGIVNRIEHGIQVVEEDAVKSEESKAITKGTVLQLGIGALFFVVGLLANLPIWAELLIFFASYVLVGGNVVVNAVRNTVRGQIFDENFLMTISTIGAFAIKQFPEAVAVMLFYRIGEMFQDLAVDRSRKSISELMNIRPDYANLKQGDEIIQVSPEDVDIGDTIIVKPGEKIPLDGTVLQGFSSLDTSALTGESMLREVEADGEVLSGSVNKSGLLMIRVTKPFGESTVSKILELVQNASSRKAPTEKFITKFARYYTPAVVFTAAILAVLPPLIGPGQSFAEWIYRALVFLVVSCPCALVVSMPLGFFGGIGGASRNGILIKGSNYLEALNNIDTVVFDKTGTLTKGIFKVSELKAFGAFSESELLELAAYAESYSTHPIATSILKEFGNDIDKGRIDEYSELSGHGVKAVIKEHNVLVGNNRLMEKEAVSFENVIFPGTVVHIAVDGEYAGYIAISDELKEDSKRTIAGLKAMGVNRLAMLTGDSRYIGEAIAGRLELDEVYSELLPDQKVEKLEMLDKQKSSKGKLVFVGDGINDAPVLARADIGVAMGGIGSDAAIEAADIVIMNDEPSKLVTAVKIAKRTRNIVWQNIVFAISVKIIVLVLGALGITTMWGAVFADVGVTLLAVLNSMRVIGTRHTEIR